MDEKARQILAQIGLLDAPTIVLPTGGSGGGFVGPLIAGHYHWVLYSDRVEVPEAAFILSAGGEYWNYYFLDKDTADAMDKQVSEFGYGSQRKHVVYTEKKNLIGASENVQEKFSDVISGDVAVRTLRSAKERHQWHMIAFPSLVHAVAQMMGYDVPDLDFSELTQQDHVLSLKRDNLTDDQTREIDDLWVKLCGDTNAKLGEQGYFKDSAYWHQRSALWQALDESNDEACHRMVTDPNQRDRYATTSERLNNCFQVALSNWAEPIWGRFRFMRNPAPESVDKRVFSSTGNRVTMAVVTDLWASQTEAQESVGGDGETSATTVAVSGPEVPQEYIAAGFDAATFGDEVKRTASKPVPLAAKEMGLDASVVSEWREHLGIG